MLIGGNISGCSKQVGASVNGGDYSLQIAINNTDGTVDWTNGNDFNRTTTEWQHAAAEIKPQKSFNSVDVYYYFYNQTGCAYFDSMRLEAQGTFTTNSYGAKGNYVMSVKDPNGNTVLLGNDAAGNIAAQYSYDAWGNILSQTGAMTSGNPYRYAGYRYDDGTGLYYLMARYYDANVGKFITRDTYMGHADAPLSLNLIAYCCNNNPINYVDPRGHTRINKTEKYW